MYIGNSYPNVVHLHIIRKYKFGSHLGTPRTIVTICVTLDNF